jgi:hypothetical protein
MDLYNELLGMIEELNVSIKQLRTNGTKLAEAEKDYKITLRTEALKLKADGLPVTLINQVIYGVQEVADKRFARDVAEAIYNANQEHINATKLKMRILESQLDREWGAAKRTV